MDLCLSICPSVRLSVDLYKSADALSQPQSIGFFARNRRPSSCGHTLQKGLMTSLQCAAAD